MTTLTGGSITSPPKPRQTRGRSGPHPRSFSLGSGRGSTRSSIRRPAVGLAVGVVRDGRLEFFHGHGLADIATEHADHRGHGFRVGSITKLFTAIAVDAAVGAGPGRPRCARERLPARRIQLVARRGRLSAGDAAPPAHPHGRDPRCPPHHATCSMPASRAIGRASAAAQRGVRATAARRSPEYYRGGLRVVVEPGSAFAYSNHGYATLGQIVEDVSRVPLERYFRERIFEPLGMADSDLVRSDRIASRLATGYAFGSRGPKAVPDRDGSAPAPAGSTRRRATWPASSPPCSAVAPTSTGASSSPRRWRRCSSPTTSRTRGCRAWASGSSAPRSPATASSSTTGSCRASTRSSWWRPTTGRRHRASRTARAEPSRGCRSSSAVAPRTLLGLPEDAAAERRPAPPRDLGRALWPIPLPAAHLRPAPAADVGHAAPRCSSAAGG